MHRINTPADVVATGLVQVDAGQGVTLEVPLVPADHPALYDSGLRDIRGLVDDTSGWDAGRAALVASVERQGQVVNVSFSNLVNIADPPPAGWVDVLRLPYGFRPSDNQYGTDFVGGRIRVLANGYIQVQNPTAVLNYFGILLLTRDPAPSAPPGAPR